MSSQVATGDNDVKIEASFTDLPPDDVFEVTVFGRGSGECIAMHVGMGYWCLIDSFLRPGTSRPASLMYLEERQVDLESQVIVIAGTHFHMDHVSALNECVEKCRAARVILPQAQFPVDKLAALKLLPAKALRSQRVLASIVDNLAGRAVRYAAAGTNILPAHIAVAIASALKINPVFVSLSPSDHTVARVNDQWRLVLQASAKIPRPRPNEVSLVFGVGLGNAKVLLGGDLEDSNLYGEGWRGVDAEWPKHVLDKAGVLKVPHHGSYNADSDYLWDNMHTSPIGVVTPFTSGTRLPRNGDMSRLHTRCAHLFGAGIMADGGPGPSASAAFTALSQAAYQPIKTGYGAVRLRRSITDGNDVWHASFFDIAGALPRTTSA